MQLGGKVLGILLKVVTLIGLVVVIFGYANSYLALHIYGGKILSVGSGICCFKIIAHFRFFERCLLSVFSTVPNLM